MKKAFTALHVRLYRLLGGRLVGRIGKAPVLLLTTTGRKSGRRRTIPLLYLKDSVDLVVVASNGGADRHPAWYLNLQANGAAEVQTGSERRAVVARTASPEEHARFWPALVGLYAGYAKYAERTEREIPLVVLSAA